MRGEDTTMMLFQSTPSARRATEKALRYKLAKWISIHALREEGDLFLFCPGTPALISIHALREEGDFPSTLIKYTFTIFQSTPSARRATLINADTAAVS